MRREWYLRFLQHCQNKHIIKNQQEGPWNPLVIRWIILIVVRSTISSCLLAFSVSFCVNCLLMASAHGLCSCPLPIFIWGCHFLLICRISLLYFHTLLYIQGQCLFFSELSWLSHISHWHIFIILSYDHQVTSVRWQMSEIGPLSAATSRWNLASLLVFFVRLGTLVFPEISDAKLKRFWCFPNYGWHALCLNVPCAPIWGPLKCLT